MKGTIGMVLMGLSPFIAVAVLFGAIKGFDKLKAWRYARAVELRNANLKRYGIAPFPGTKALTTKALEEWLR